MADESREPRTNESPAEGTELGLDGPSAAAVLEQLLRGRQPPSPGKRLRRHERHACCVPIAVHLEKVVLGATRELVIAAQMRDISAGGIGFTCDQYVKPGTAVRVMLDPTGEDVPLAGIVRHCELLAGQQYRVGVQFSGAPRTGA